MVVLVGFFLFTLLFAARVFAQPPPPPPPPPPSPSSAGGAPCTLSNARWVGMSSARVGDTLTLSVDQSGAVGVQFVIYDEDTLQMTADRIKTLSETVSGGTVQSSYRFTSTDYQVGGGGALLEGADLELYFIAYSPQAPDPDRGITSQCESPRSSILTLSPAAAASGAYLCQGTTIGACYPDAAICQGSSCAQAGGTCRACTAIIPFSPGCTADGTACAQPVAPTSTIQFKCDTGLNTCIPAAAGEPSDPRCVFKEQGETCWPPTQTGKPGEATIYKCTATEATHCVGEDCDECKNIKGGWLPLVPCGRSDQCDTSCRECKFCDLFKLVQNIILFAVFEVVPPIAVFFIALGGLLILLSAGNEQRRSQGKAVLKTTLIGIVVIFTSWIIINTVIKTFATNLVGGSGGTWYSFTCSGGAAGAVPSVCGDGTCDAATEDCVLCAADCGACSPPGGGVPSPTCDAVTNCVGRQCGPDGCGGACPPGCPQGIICTVNGLCPTPTSTPSPTPIPTPTPTPSPIPTPTPTPTPTPMPTPTPTPTPTPIPTPTPTPTPTQTPTPTPSPPPTCDLDGICEPWAGDKCTTCVDCINDRLCTYNTTICGAYEYVGGKPGPVYEQCRNDAYSWLLTFLDHLRVKYADPASSFEFIDKPAGLGDGLCNQYLLPAGCDPKSTQSCFPIESCSNDPADCGPCPTIANISDTNIATGICNSAACSDSNCPSPPEPVCGPSPLGSTGFYSSADACQYNCNTAHYGGDTGCGQTQSLAVDFLVTGTNVCSSLAYWADTIPNGENFISYDLDTPRTLHVGMLTRAACPAYPDWQVPVNPCP